MTRFGYFLSSEEYDPASLIAQAKLAEQAGFEALWISDHFPPWLDEQGESTFVWSMIGALSQVTDLPITTAVTCPTTRIHPAIIAQAAATAGLLTGEQLTHRGTHYTVDTARLYSVPSQPPPIYVSGFGEHSARLAARVADGYICMGPKADLIKLYRDQGGGDRPVQGAIKVCWAPDNAQARRTMHRLWPTDTIPGESAQLLP